MPDTAERAVEIAEGGGLAHTARRSRCAAWWARSTTPSWATSSGPCRSSIPAGECGRLRARRSPFLTVLERHVDRYRYLLPPCRPVRTACDPRGEAPGALGVDSRYQQRPAHRSSRCAPGSPEHTAMCVLTGAVSGSLEMVDFDRPRLSCSTRWRELVGHPGAGAGRAVCWSSVPSPAAAHAIYRCTVPVPGNRKLAAAHGGRAPVPSRSVSPR